MPLRSRTILIVWTPIVMCMVFISACAPSSIIKPSVIEMNSQYGFIHAYDDFVIVKSIEGDTLDSLAATYLNDPSMAWIIAEFNGIDTLLPGEEVAIPLKPIHLGGLMADGLQKVPILLYHDFSKTRSSKMKVLETSFEAQMRFLKENDYHVITLDRFLKFMEFKEQIPKKSVVITIDDGWKSLYTIAYPILKKYHFPASLFVYTDFVGGKKALTWDQIKELSDNGFDIQCHTKTHRNLTKTQDGETFDLFFKSVAEEITHPKKLLKQKLNRDCSCMAYPYGETSSLVAAMTKKHGYRAAFTVTRGGNPFYLHAYNINRSAIYGHYDLDKFKQNLDVFQPLGAE
jgi:peptidoglycan/xylan/chitin deacetylase (PgdA/CDA1 family)